MKSGAQREDPGGWDIPGGPAAYAASLFPAEESAAALRRLAAERLAAHRSRRAALHPEPDPPAAPAQPAALPDAAARVREAVAARYRSTISYQQFLDGASDIDQLAHYDPPAPAAQPVVSAFVASTAPFAAEPAAAAPAAATPHFFEEEEEFLPQVASPTDFTELPAATFTAPPLTEPVEANFSDAAPETTPTAPAPDLFFDATAAALDDEIAFRAAPHFDEHLLEPLALQANIIEFPRQLVAAKKARPRLAEAPLLALDDAPPEPEVYDPQLRIFEVAPAAQDAPPAWQTQPLGSAAPAPPAAPPHITLPELDLDPEHEAAVRRLVEQDERALDNPDILLRESPPLPGPAVPGLYTPVFTAGIDLRLMAMLVDTICVALFFVLFSGVGVIAAGPALHRLAAWKLACLATLSWVGLFTAYQWLFLTLGEATPGMAYAKLSLCTFADAAPTRKMRQRRVWTTLLAVAPACLGLLWALIDTDHLGWHDKWSRTYPRSY